MDAHSTKSVFLSGEKEVTVYPAKEPGNPVIYLNTFENEGEKVLQLIKADHNTPDFTLVTIQNLEWNQDLSPWEIPPVTKWDEPFTGGADAYLAELTGELIPCAEEKLGVSPCWRGIAGYSMAGLFAVYALFRTEAFDCVASMSGSLWFPDFKEYVYAHVMQKNPDCVYLSLGDRECRTKNPVLCTVQENTEALAEYFRGQGVRCVFELNPGNHFADSVERTAKGIRWVLEQGSRHDESGQDLSCKPLL